MAKPQEFKGIECPKCACRDLRVWKTIRYENVIVRRRECRHCGNRNITTRERVSSNSPTVG